jgi:outer membrane lipoprotein-sorting protein
MHPGIKLVIASFVALILLPGLRASAAPADQRDLNLVLQQLNTAAKNFQSTSADLQVDSVLSDPVYERDVQKGAVEYKRSGKSFKMIVHFREEAFDVQNGKPAKFEPVPKDLLVADGKATLYEKRTNEVHTKDASKFESYAILGFGASGTQLAEKWDIKYLGSEPLVDGKTSIATDKLELVAKDPDVRKLLPKVTIWIDPNRAVSLKQVFDEGQGQSRTCYYSNIKLNPTLPENDFTINPESKTKVLR